MCLHNHPGIQARGVDKEAADVIVRLHNEFRATVKPPATDMVAMVISVFITQSQTKNKQINK